MEHQCEVCGWVGTEEKPVTYDYDPYGYEIHGDNANYWMCEDCRRQSAEDV